MVSNGLTAQRVDARCDLITPKPHLEDGILCVPEPGEQRA
jgi:hypothetical protein